MYLRYFVAAAVAFSLPFGIVEAANECHWGLKGSTVGTLGADAAVIRLDSVSTPPCERPGVTRFLSLRLSGYELTAGEPDPDTDLRDPLKAENGALYWPGSPFELYVVPVNDPPGLRFDWRPILSDMRAVVGCESDNAGGIQCTVSSEAGVGVGQRQDYPGGTAAAVESSR